MIALLISMIASYSESSGYFLSISRTLSFFLISYSDGALEPMHLRSEAKN